jgi:protein gp88
MNLLVNGNEKLGAGIGAFSIPSVTTCPGRTELCAKLCYAERYQKRWGTDYTPKLKATKREDFVKKMVAEAQWRTLVRVHVSGDFYSSDYVQDWIEIARLCPKTTFYAYTRSWRDRRILPTLRKLGALSNFKLLFSCDRESGIPAWAPASSLVWMATDDGDLPPAAVKIVFRVKRTTVMAKMAGSTICPKENGIKNPVTCGACKLCFK